MLKFLFAAPGHCSTTGYQFFAPGPDLFNVLRTYVVRCKVTYYLVVNSHQLFSKVIDNNFMGKIYFKSIIKSMPCTKFENVNLVGFVFKSKTKVAIKKPNIFSRRFLARINSTKVRLQLDRMESKSGGCKATIIPLSQSSKGYRTDSKIDWKVGHCSYCSCYQLKYKEHL
jgi:hypothetical protein